MLKPLLYLSTFLLGALGVGSAQVTVRIERSDLQSPRALPEQTRAAVIHDYLKSWQTLRSALEQNRSELLDASFIGSAREKLTETIGQQSALGIRTEYQDREHDIQIVFYSPDGLSIELRDKVEYDVEVLDRDRVKMTQHVVTHYVIVLTPAEVQWRVRVFQAAGE